MIQRTGLKYSGSRKGATMATPLDRWTTRKSRELPAGTPAMGASEVQEALRDLPGWQLKGDAIAKTFKFNDYHETIAFVNRVADVANAENHHPELVVGYNRCEVRYNTHSVGGISENDFICAAKIEAMQ
jgi:4a-hydroxytetrahydrobiopterin dehydratase